MPDLVIIDGGKGQVARGQGGPRRAGPARPAARRARQGARGAVPARPLRPGRPAADVVARCTSSSGCATRPTASRSRTTATCARSARPAPRSTTCRASARSAGGRCSGCSARRSGSARPRSSRSRRCPGSARRWRPGSRRRSRARASLSGSRQERNDSIPWASQGRRHRSMATDEDADRDRRSTDSARSPPRQARGVRRDPCRPLFRHLPPVPPRPWTLARWMPDPATRPPVPPVPAAAAKLPTKAKASGAGPSAALARRPRGAAVEPPPGVGRRHRPGPRRHVLPQPGVQSRLDRARGARRHRLRRRRCGALTGPGRCDPRARRGTPALMLVPFGVSVGMLAFFVAYAAVRLYGRSWRSSGCWSSPLARPRSRSWPIYEPSRSSDSLLARAPPIMGGPVTIVTVVLLGAALGTSLIASYRPWAWLPALAFVTTSPQLASWLFDQSNIALALAAIAAYWLVNALGATGYALRRPRPIVHAGPALHLVGLGCSRCSPFGRCSSTSRLRAGVREVLAGSRAAGRPFIRARRGASRGHPALRDRPGGRRDDHRPRDRPSRPTVVLDGDRRGTRVSPFDSPGRRRRSGRARWDPSWSSTSSPSSTRSRRSASSTLRIRPSVHHAGGDRRSGDRRRRAGLGWWSSASCAAVRARPGCHRTCRSWSRWRAVLERSR